MRFLLCSVFAFFSVSTIAQAPPKLIEKSLRTAFEDRLKDSESARFKDIKYQPTGTPGGWTMCGEVNAKNSYGAYRGFEPFLAMAVKEGREPIQYLLLGVGEAAGEVCRKEGLRQ